MVPERENWNGLNLSLPGASTFWFTVSKTNEDHRTAIFLDMCRAVGRYFQTVKQLMLVWVTEHTGQEENEQADTYIAS